MIRDTLQEIISYIFDFHYRLVCKEWSKIWNYIYLIEIMIRKDDPKYLKDVIDRNIPIDDENLYGGTNWRISMRNLGLIKMSQTEEIIHAINLNDKQTLEKYKEKIPPLLPFLARPLIRCIEGNWLPKDEIGVINGYCYGELCSKFLPPPKGNESAFATETAMLYFQDKKECRRWMKRVDRGIVLEEFCKGVSNGFGLCKFHLKEEIDRLRIMGFLFLIPQHHEMRRVRCLAKFNEVIQCDYSHPEHRMCFYNSYSFDLSSDD